MRTKQASIDIASRLGRVVLRLNRRLRRHSGMTVTASQLALLGTINSHGSLSLGELASFEGVQPPSITRMVAALESAGLLQRSPSLDDRRSVLVELTAEGRQTLDEIRARRTAWLAEALDELSDAERSALEGALTVLEAIVDTHG